MFPAFSIFTLLKNIESWVEAINARNAEKSAWEVLVNAVRQESEK